MSRSCRHGNCRAEREQARCRGLLTPCQAPAPTHTIPAFAVRPRSARAPGSPRHLLHHPHDNPKTVTDPSTPPLTPPPDHAVIARLMILSNQAARQCQCPFLEPTRARPARSCRRTPFCTNDFTRVHVRTQRHRPSLASLCGPPMPAPSPTAQPEPGPLAAAHERHFARTISPACTSEPNGSVPASHPCAARHAGARPTPRPVRSSGRREPRARARGSA